MKNNIYNAYIGTFEIRHIDHLCDQLLIEDELFDEYTGAKPAALGTDYEKWDQLKNKLDIVPTDLSYGTAIIVEITR